MEIQVDRRWSAAANAEFRGSVTGVLMLDGASLCFTLEPSALMIPAGSYPVVMAWSHRFSRNTPHIQNVTGRSEIEIHGGNRATDSDGCVLVAEYRLSDYEIYESAPATEAVENALMQAEANGERSTVTITDAIGSFQSNSA